MIEIYLLICYYLFLRIFKKFPFTIISFLQDISEKKKLFRNFSLKEKEKFKQDKTNFPLDNIHPISIPLLEKEISRKSIDRSIDRSSVLLQITSFDPTTMKKHSKRALNRLIETQQTVENALSSGVVHQKQIGTRVRILHK